jgi:hypothetical protein
MTIELAPEERPSKRLRTGECLDTEDAETPPLSMPETTRTMNDSVLEKESKVGITSFVSGSRPALRGLVKKRYVDFLVNEVLPGGRVLRLRKTTAERESKSGETDTKAWNLPHANETPLKGISAKSEELPQPVTSTSTEQAVNGMEGKEKGLSGDTPLNETVHSLAFAQEMWLTWCRFHPKTRRSLSRT